MIKIILQLDDCFCNNCRCELHKGQEVFSTDNYEAEKGQLLCGTCEREMLGEEE